MVHSAHASPTPLAQVDIAVPFLMSLTAETGFEVRTPRQFKVRFESVGLDTHVRTPSVLANLEVPDSVRLMGRTVDLKPLEVGAPNNAVVILLLC